MASSPQVFFENQPIADPATGLPTDYFLRTLFPQVRAVNDIEHTLAVLQETVALKADKSVVLTAGVGLSGGGSLEESRTFDLEDTPVTPGSYTNADITVDQQGRVLAAANGSGGGGGGLTYIGEDIAAGGETSLVVSSIPDTYRDLVVTFYGRSSGAGAAVPVTLNAISSGYDMQRQYATNTTNTANQALNQASWGDAFAVASSGSTSGFISGGELELIGYADTNFNTLMISTARHLSNDTSGAAFIVKTVGQVRSTAAITSVTFGISAASFAAGSKITVYGRG